MPFQTLQENIKIFKITQLPPFKKSKQKRANYVFLKKKHYLPFLGVKKLELTFVLKLLIFSSV